MAKKRKVEPIGDVEFVNKETKRGNELIRFRDYYGRFCSLQMSSISEPACIWLGREPMSDVAGTGIQSVRMHLSEEQVLSLIQHLENWIEKGTFKFNSKETK